MKSSWLVLTFFYEWIKMDMTVCSWISIKIQAYKSLYVCTYSQSRIFHHRRFINIHSFYTSTRNQYIFTTSRQKLIIAESADLVFGVTWEAQQIFPVKLQWSFVSFVSVTSVERKSCLLCCKVHELSLLGQWTKLLYAIKHPSNIALCNLGSMNKLL